MFAGHGDSQPCDGCDTVILPNQVQYEFDTPNGRIIRLHLRCYGLWEAERRRRGWVGPQPD